jgi:hypothetical protein
VKNDKVYLAKVSHTHNLCKSVKLWKTLWKVWKTLQIKASAKGKYNLPCGKLAQNLVNTFFEKSSFSLLCTTKVKTVRSASARAASFSSF